MRCEVNKGEKKSPFCCPGEDPGNSFEMLLCEATGETHVISVPLLPFDRPPVGTGDLTTGLFLVKLLQGADPRGAFEHTASAYQAVMQATLDLGEYELQTVAAQDEIATPTTTFESRPL